MFIKKVFCYPNDISDNAFDREVLGASFEPYNMFVQPAERIQKFKQFHLSDPILAGFFS